MIFVYTIEATFVHFFGEDHFGDIMEDEHAKLLAQILNGADVKYLGEKVSTTDRVLAVVADPYSWPFILLGSKNIFMNLFTNTKGTLITVGVSSGVNAGIQYGFTGEVKLSEVIGS
jgi:filamentous hemagglutinin